MKRIFSLLVLLASFLGSSLGASEQAPIELQITPQERDLFMQDLSRVKGIQALAKPEGKAEFEEAYSLKTNFAKTPDGYTIEMDVDLEVSLDPEIDEFDTAKSKSLDSKLYDFNGRLKTSTSTYESKRYLNGKLLEEETKSIKITQHADQALVQITEKETQQKTFKVEKPTENHLDDFLLVFAIVNRNYPAGTRIKYSYGEYNEDKEEWQPTTSIYEVVSHSDKGTIIKEHATTLEKGREKIELSEFSFNAKKELIQVTEKSDSGDEMALKLLYSDIASETQKITREKAGIFSSGGSTKPDEIEVENAKKQKHFYVISGPQHNLVEASPNSTLFRTAEKTYLIIDNQNHKIADDGTAIESEKKHSIDTFIPEAWVVDLQKQIQGKDFKDQVKTISSFIQSKIKWANTNSIELSMEQCISLGKGDCNAISDVAAALLRRLGLPARVAIGLYTDIDSKGGHAWVEVQNPTTGKWHMLEPQNGMMDGDAGASYFIKIASGPTYKDYRAKKIEKFKMTPLREEDFYKELPAEFQTQKPEAQESFIDSLKRKFQHWQSGE